MKWAKKLGLGTVQWGMPYGIANRTGQPSVAEVGKLLGLARDNGISLLDTAHAYGNSETVLGTEGAIDQGFRIITKTPPIKAATSFAEYGPSISDAFAESLVRLKCAKLHGLLVHSPDALLTADGDLLWRALASLKNQRLVDKIGVSVYRPDQLAEVISRYPLDLVQLPFNIYDQRFLQSGQLQMLKEKGVEIHARSAFLQGLLLQNAADLPDYFSPIREHQLRLHAHICESGMTLLQASIGFCLYQPLVDAVIVGCETHDQLHQILQAAEDVPVTFPAMSEFAIGTERFVNPANWPKISAN